LPRNNLLFGLLQRMELVEKAGTGIKRMRDEMKKYRLDVPEIETNENWFTIIFKRPEESYEERFYGEIRKKTTQKTTQKILELMRETPNITRKKIAKTLGITEDGVKYHIDKLRKNSIIRRVGGRKGGHWEVIQDDKGY